MKRLVAIAALAIALLATAQPAGSNHVRPNVLLIVLDTVRFDAVNPANTPFLASLAQSGILWTNAYATHDFTPPSHFSIMTGFRDGLGGDEDRVENGVASHLHQSGYWTFATVANGLIGEAQMPVMRGFDDFKQIGDVNTGTSLDVMTSMIEVDQRLAMFHVRPTPHTRGMVYYSADRLLPVFLAQMRAAKKRPFFGFVNLVDAHEPYVPDPNDYPPERVLPPGFQGDVMARRLGPELAHPDRIKNPERRAYVEAKIKAVRFPRLVSIDLSPAALAIYHRRYNARVHELDMVLRQFFEEAGREHLLDNTIVVITSDHGESFGESDLISHMFNDQGDDESTHHVPMMVILAKRMPRKETRIDRRVSIASIAPTIYDFAGIDATPYRTAFTGWARSLAPLMTTVPPRVAVATPPPHAKQQLAKEAAEREKAMRSLGYIH